MAEISPASRTRPAPRRGSATAGEKDPSIPWSMLATIGLYILGIAYFLAQVFVPLRLAVSGKDVSCHVAGVTHYPEDVTPDGTTIAEYWEVFVDEVPGTFRASSGVSQGDTVNIRFDAGMRKGVLVAAGASVGEIMGTYWGPLVGSNMLMLPFACVAVVVGIVWRAAKLGMRLEKLADRYVFVPTENKGRLRSVVALTERASNGAVLLLVLAGAVALMALLLRLVFLAYIAPDVILGVVLLLFGVVLLTPWPERAIEAVFELRRPGLLQDVLVIVRNLLAIASSVALIVRTAQFVIYTRFDRYHDLGPLVLDYLRHLVDWSA